MGSAPNPVTGVLTRGTQRQPLGRGSHRPRAQGTGGHHQKLGEQVRETIPLLLEGAWPSQHLAFVCPRSVGGFVSIVSSHPVCSVRPGTPMQTPDTESPSTPGIFSWPADPSPQPTGSQVSLSLLHPHSLHPKVLWSQPLRG